MNGRPRSDGGGDEWKKYIKAFDAFPKQREEAAEFFHRSVSGGVITIVTAILMGLLFLSELGLYLKHTTRNTLAVDTSRGETMAIHVDVTMPRLPCSWLSIDAMDVSGDVHLEVNDHGLYKQRLDRRGNVVQQPELHEFGPKEKKEVKEKDPNACGSCYGAETEQRKCCNSCAEVREAYRKKNWSFSNVASVQQCVDEGVTLELDAQRGEGCRVYGDLTINKVAGNIHIAPGHSYQQGGLHMHDLTPFIGEKPFDLSHTIHRLAFGIEYPGMKNPLDGHKVRQKPLPIQTMEGGIPAGGAYQYYLKVVPTKYVTIGNSTINSNQYSVTETYKDPIPGTYSQLPGVFFFYDLSPVLVTFQEERRSFFSFITSACAIVGGLFTISGIIDSTVYSGQRLAKQKMGIGKLS